MAKEIKYIVGGRYVDALGKDLGPVEQEKPEAEQEGEGEGTARRTRKPAEKD